MILDEADEMLSMGFKDDLEMIILTSESKQTLLSAHDSKMLSSQKIYAAFLETVARTNLASEKVQHVYMVQAKTDMR